MTRTQDLTTVLRALDPADRDVDPSSHRARTDLDRILATDPSTGRVPEAVPGFTPDGVGGRPRPVRRARRVLLASGAVAAVTAGLVLMPPLTGGDEAFATWTGAPGEVPVHQRPGAVDRCRASHEDVADELADDLARALPAIAEQRGAWTTVVLAGADGFSAMCVTDASAGLLDRSMIGSIGKPASGLPGPRDVVATDLGMGTTGAGNLSLAGGMVGDDVAGLVYRSAAHGEVVATVSEGRFAFWLPGDELVEAASEGVEVEVTYRDGGTGSARLTL